MKGSIRVVNKRNHSTVKPFPDETVIDGDRGTVFGNPYVLDDSNDDKERARVISLFKKRLLEDLANEGAMWGKINRLAWRVKHGEHIALQCWCAPKSCHLDLVVKEVKLLAGIE